MRGNCTNTTTCSRYIEKEKIEIGNRWYAGKVNRQICDSAIADAKHGDFLVRESSSSNNMVLVVHDAGQVRDRSILAFCCLPMFTIRCR